jgi:cytochrome c peroxidase
MQFPRALFVAAVVVGGAGCESAADSLFCGSAGCEWPAREWDALSALAAPADWKPPEDRSNKYVGNEAAEKLGHKFYWDRSWSGPSNQVDVLKRPVGYARADAGQATNLSCVSCHNLARSGIDTESLPGNVSIGAAWADTNALPVVNAAFYGIQYWNGRADSLWAQAINSNEGTNMNGNRLSTAWLIYEKYKAEYDAVFGAQYPLPFSGTRAGVQAIVEVDGARAGQCKLNPGCPTNLGCREVRDADTGATGCFPRYPLAGKPGSKTGCQPGDSKEPHGDAWDCMADEDKDGITWVLVSYAKAVAAYEFRLVSKESPFDQWVRTMRNGEPRPARFSVAAERGARLFVGKAACVDCHSTPLFSDSKFHNVGVAQVGPGVPTEADCPAGGVCDCVTEFADHLGNNCLPWGATDGLWKLTRSTWRRDSKWSDDPTDTSRDAWRKMDMKRIPKGTWRTPSLRDVAVTAPYMHNGSLPTLEAVIEHYNQGGSSNVTGTRSAQIKPLLLTTEEKADLVEFLKSLNGAPLPPELVNAPE